MWQKIIRYAILLLFVLSSAVAQPASEFPDPVGDVRMTSTGTAVDAPYLDITALRVVEASLYELWIEIDVVDSEEPTDAPLVVQRSFHATFAVENTSFALLDPEPGCRGPALVSDGVRCLDWEPTPNGFRYRIPHTALRTTEGLLSAGTTIQDILLRSSALVAPAPSPVGAQEMEDLVPDQGFGEHILQGGIEYAPASPLHISAPAFVKATNGEAAPFIFVIKIESREPIQISVEAGESTSPIQSVFVPDQLVVEQEGLLPIAVTTAFAHEHGKTITLPITLRDADGDILARFPVGIHWLDVPQPSGHHSRLWFHSAVEQENHFTAIDTRPPVWLSALEEDERDVNEPVRGTWNGTDPNPANPTSSAVWRVPLSPMLGLGLHWDEGEAAKLHISLRAAMTTETGVLHARVLHCLNGSQATGCREPTTVWAHGRQEGVTMTAGTVSRYELALALEGEPRLPHVPGSNLVLELDLHSSPPIPVFDGLPAPELQVDDSHLDLPLLEFRDDADLQGDLTIEPIGPRFANPGRTITWEVATTAAVLHVAGGPPGLIGVKHSQEGFSVSLRVPESAVPGHDFVLAFMAMDDNGLHALGYATVNVVDSATQDIPDEAKADPQRNAPLVAVPLLLLLLGACGRLLRR